jgi:RHS repeat-associated protein
MSPQTLPNNLTEFSHVSIDNACPGSVVRKLTLAVVIGLLLLFQGFFNSAWAQQCDSCESKGVRVGVQGVLFTSGGAGNNVHIGVDGINVANGVWTGSDPCNDIILTNEGFFYMKPGRTYLVDAGWFLCVTNINFDVPDGYDLYIKTDASYATNDYYHKATTIHRTNGGFAQTGDGAWEIVLRESCPSCGGTGSGKPGESTGPEMGTLGSVVWSTGLGDLSDSRSAGSISIRESYLSSQTFTPNVLIYTPPENSTEVEDIRVNNDGSVRSPTDQAVIDSTWNSPFGILRQVKTAQALTDIVTISSSEFDVRFYRPADVGAKVAGLYSVTGQPFVTWKMKNPNPATTDHLQISKIQPSGTDTNDMAWDSVGGSWSMTKGGGTSVATTLSIVNPSDANERTETGTTKDNNNQVASKIARTYYTFPWGEEITKEVLDPDGAALTTTYTYYQNSAETGRYGRLQSVARADGLWEKYDYDGNGNTIQVLRPWKDLTIDNGYYYNSHETLYTYTNNDGVTTLPFNKLVSSVEEQAEGRRIKYQTISRASTTVNGQTAVTETRTNYSSSSVGLVTKTTTYYETAPALLANRTAYTDYPDGRRDTYTYEKGDYTTNADPSLNAFTPNVNGVSERDTVIHGTVASPNGIAFKTTEETSIQDQFGNSVLSETYVYNGATYERIGWTVFGYNDRGQPIQTSKSNNEVTTYGWNGDQKTIDTDGSGVETDYTYDSLSRVKTSTKKGVAANGGFSAQVDIITTYNYDAQGRTLSTIISGSGLSLANSRAYDPAGRILSETDPAGLVTNHSYANGGLTHTTTLAGGATLIADKYIDGRSKSETGTAIIAHAFDYGVNTDGTKYRQEFIGSLGLTSPRWIKTTSDWLDRTMKIEKPSFTGVNAVNVATYNTAGQLQRERESYGVGTVKLRADRLYEYDELGTQVRVGNDVDGSGGFTASSTDRYAETITVFEKNGSDWFRKTTSTTYAKDNDTTVTTTIQKERLNNFPVNGTVKTTADVITIDVAGNSTETTTTVDSAAKNITATTIAPDSTTNAVSITINGLLQSSTPSTPQSATTYAYDALGRPVSVTEPRTGVSTKSYHATTGQLISASEGANTLTYAYYTNAESNAGRVKSQTNAAGKKVYFIYSSRSELLQTWGDTTYPLEFVYDSYGQKTEMHTFRGGSGWTASTWPTATTGTADVSKWIYQDSTGLLTQKQDATTQGIVYTYDLLGRPITRKWARASGGNQITTTYAYDVSTGNQTVIGYSDGTPQVTMSYDRAGRPRYITDAAGAHTLAYNQAGEFQSEAISGGALDGVNVSVGFDTVLRRNSLQVTRSATTYLSQAYGYDPTSRLSTVTSGTQTATYAYYSTSGLLNTTNFTGGTNLARSYDSFGRLQSTTTTPAADTAVSYTYTYNNLNQRTRVTREDGSYWSYAYNDRGELIFGKKYWSDNSLVAAQQNEYVFDNLGNRISTLGGGDAAGANLRSATYTTNSLNQYSQRTVPGAVDIIGTAAAAANVTVNGQAPYRRSEYFAQTLTLSNTAAPVYAQANITGVRTGAGPGGQDVVTNQSGYVYLPKTPEAFTYDLDGNLTSDGRWTYTWDAENRLTTMTALTGVPNSAKRRLEFIYDGIGRRVQKKVYNWNALTATYQLQSTTKFVYDGWNPIAELDASGALLRSYVWGQDISTTLHGAGGVGGLLLISQGGNNYAVGYDGTENVTTLVKTSDGTVAASYEYDPFGNTLKSLGAYAATNPIAFSTKYLDRETGLIYYGYRYYSPQTGRWISRDPIASDDGINLYAYVVNRPIDFTDPDGRQIRRDWKRVHHHDFDKESPNWDFAEGQMDHTYHHIALCFKKMDLDRAVKEIYSDLEVFAHFNSPTKNIANVSINGNRAHFDLDPSLSATASFIAGNSIDVALAKYPERGEMMAMTIGDHPLVGVREWSVKKSKVTIVKPTRVDIETEAYEQVNGLTTRFGRWWNGRDQQDRMWSTYLENIADHWWDAQRATVIMRESRVEAAAASVNPLKSKLPADLQKTRYHDYDEIIQY